MRWDDIYGRGKAVADKLDSGIYDTPGKDVRVMPQFGADVGQVVEGDSSLRFMSYIDDKNVTGQVPAKGPTPRGDPDAMDPVFGDRTKTAGEEDGGAGELETVEDGSLDEFANPGTFGGKSTALGGGGRFAALKSKLTKKGVEDPGGLAAWIGRKKYGAGKMAAMSAKGRGRA